MAYVIVFRLDDDNVGISVRQLTRSIAVRTARAYMDGNPHVQYADLVTVGSHPDQVFRIIPNGPNGDNYDTIPMGLPHMCYDDGVLRYEI